MRIAAARDGITDIRFPAVVLSLLISAWLTYTVGIINYDGILYLSVARLIEAGDWSGACRLHQCWLLYPSLIAAVGKLAGIGLESAAYLLAAVFYGLLVYAFLTLVRELGANRATLGIAAFVILSHPFLNEARVEIIRGHGYWALYLLMVLFFIRFMRDTTWTFAFAWTCAAVAATLFRIEGMVFLLFMPLVLLVDTTRRLPERLERLLKAHAFTGMLMLGLLALWLLAPGILEGRSGRLFEPVQRLGDVWEQLNTGLETRAQVMGKQILGNWLDQYASSGLWAVLLLVIFLKVVNTLSPLYSLLLLPGKLRSRFIPPAGVMPVIVWLVLLNLGILLVELLTLFILSGRFAVPLALTLMLVVPFILEAIYSQWKRGELRGWQRWLGLPVVLASLLFMTVDGIPSTGREMHDYLRDAGLWLQERVSRDSSVFSNDTRVSYYSGQDSNRGKQVSRNRTIRMLSEESWRQYNYIAIHIDDDDMVLRRKVAETLGEPAMEFSNSKRDSVLVFETAAPAR